jgi:hypothetical protein
MYGYTVPFASPTPIVFPCALMNINKANKNTSYYCFLAYELKKQKLGTRIYAAKYFGKNLSFIRSIS